MTQRSAEDAECAKRIEQLFAERQDGITTLIAEAREKATEYAEAMIAALPSPYSWVAMSMALKMLEEGNKKVLTESMERVK